MPRTRYITYQFEEVRYCPFGIYKSAYQMTYDFEVEITYEDIIAYYFQGCSKELKESVKRTLTTMDTYDLLNWETLENDNDFYEWLKQENESDAYNKLVEELEESERDI